MREKGTLATSRMTVVTQVIKTVTGKNPKKNQSLHLELNRNMSIKIAKVKYLRSLKQR